MGCQKRKNNPKYLRRIISFFLLLLSVNTSIGQIINTEILKQRSDDSSSEPKTISQDQLTQRQDSSNNKTASGKGNLAGSLSVAFVKSEEKIPPGVMFFNVFKIHNHSGDTVSFMANFEKPSFANLLLQEEDKGLIKIGPNEKRYMPIRVSFPSGTEGGVGHKIIASLMNEEEELGPFSSQVTFQKNSKWQISTPFTKLFISKEDESFNKISLQLNNTGNCLENLRFEFSLGKYLEVEHEELRSFVWEIPASPGLDTVINVWVKSRPAKGSFPDSEDNTLHLKVISPNDTVPQKISVYLEGIARDFQRVSDLANAPLIIGYTQQGADPATSQLNVGGKILLKDQQEISYNLQTKTPLALLGAKQSGKDFFQNNSKANIQYTNERSFYQLGNVGGGDAVDVSGLGVSLGRKFGSLESEKGVETRLIAAYSKGAKEFGLAGSARGNLKPDLSWESSAGIKKNFEDQSMLVGVQAGSQYSFLESHSVGVKVKSTYRSGPDSLAGAKGLGTAYSLNYSGSIGEKLNLGIENEFVSKNFGTGDGGLFNFRAEAGYELSESSSLGGSLTSQSTLIMKDNDDGTREVIGKTKSSSINAAYNTQVGKFSIGAGFNKSFSTKTDIKNSFSLHNESLGFQFGVGTQFTSKHEEPWVLAPSLIVGTQFSSIDNIESSSSQTSNISSTLGVSGSHKNFSFDTKYSVESTQASTLSEDIEEGSKQHFEASASYEVSLWDDRLGYKTSANVKYDITERVLESLVLNSLEYKLDNGWGFGLDTKFDLSKLLKGNSKKVASFAFKATKAFDMSQPRLKYYNLVIDFFKDENGNRERDPNEMGVISVLVRMERVKDPHNLVVNGEKVVFNPPETLSDESGKVSYSKIPQGHYLVKLKELMRIKDFANLNGVDFEVFMGKHARVSIPFSRSVTISGKTTVTRDKFSRLFGISPAKIRVSVEDANGKKHYTLTSGNGSYSMTLPYSEKYLVSMKNVLGSKFDLTVPEHEIVTEVGQTSYLIDFLYKEKGRSINFGN